MTSGVYQILNTVNGKCYVGSSIDIHNRWRKHRAMLRAGRHDSLKLTRAVAKHGFAVFAFEILEECEKERTLDREGYWIGMKQSVKNGYNTRVIPNSNIGLTHSEATRKILSKKSKGNTSAKGAVRTPETLARLSASHQNTSQELRDAISARNNGNTYCEGYVHGPETRARMSESKRGKKQSPETIAKRVAGLIGKKHSPERRAKAAAAQVGRKMSPEAIAKSAATKAANKAKREAQSNQSGAPPVTLPNHLTR